MIQASVLMGRGDVRVRGYVVCGPPGDSQVRRTCMRTIFLIVIGSILLNVAFAELGRGDFSHGIIVFALIAYIAVPAALVGLVGVALGRPLSNPRTMSRIAFGIAIVVASTLVSLPIGTAKLEQDIQAAKGYCESLIPRLEAHKRQHGMYP